MINTKEPDFRNKKGRKMERAICLIFDSLKIRFMKRIFYNTFWRIQT